MSENQEPPNPAPAAGSSSPGVRIEAGPLHEALFLVLSYLPLFELLSMSAVCVSLRNAVEHDVWPWLHIVVDRPLSYRLSDDILRRIARKADGRLRTLALINCFKISDSGLHEVVEKNPLLTKLYVPGCTSLTPGGVVRAVKTLSQHSHNLKSLMIDGIIEKYEHLEVLKCYLLINRSQQLQEKQQKQQHILYHEQIDRLKLLSDEYQPMIDVQICPKCHEIRRVYDCSRERCKIKQEEKLQTDCRGCSHCLPRCEDCGGCVDEYELEEAVCAGILCVSCWLQLPKCDHCNRDDIIEEAVCAGILCSSCWLQLPKCNHCNRPYCKRHCDNVLKKLPQLWLLTSMMSNSEERQYFRRATRRRRRRLLC